MNIVSGFKRWRRQRAAQRIQVSDDLWTRVESRLPFLAFLGAPDRVRLRRMALELLAEKEIAGAHGFAVKDEARLSIALQACLPILNLGLERYDGWIGIVVYPGDFVIPRHLTDEHGIVHEYAEHALGEAWVGGPVLVSWQSDDDRDDGINVVIHEFAHKLDMQNGSVDGFPALHAEMSRAAWREAFQSAYDDFRRFVERGGDPWLDPYAAESPSEFFAVISEAFFETPSLVREDMPAVYEQLRRFYRQDPAAGELRCRAERHDA